ncbi:MAG: polyphosphate:AMP phosphotransferase [Methylotetracoccus sp.]
MFELANLKNSVPKREYAAAIPAIRTELLELQQRLEQAAVPVVCVIAGVDGAGKGDLIGVLNEWLDPRYMRTHAYGEPSDEERERPSLWRYWMNLPERGHIALNVFAWYAPPISDSLYRALGNSRLDAELARINRLEKALVDDGALIVKFWLHLSRKQQRKRFRKLEANPETAWRISDVDRRHLKLYDPFVAVAERVLRETSTPHAPWFILNADDGNYRRLTVARQFIESVSARLGVPPHGAAGPFAPVRNAAGSGLLGALDLGVRLERRTYQERKAQYQGKLSLATRRLRAKGRSCVLLFEGWDASGKGGVIRRLTPALDARNYRVIPIAAPTDEERSRHYLWRFWRHLPRSGKVIIYDRSWYGRVLVERVEGLASVDEWMRAYSEINDFEEDLTEHGIVLLKFWLHISRDEQMRRFEDRQNTAYKRYKITDEDYRNRERWEQYEVAVDEMVTRTSTAYAPWHLIPANDKYHARIQVLKRVCKVLDKSLC